MKYLRKGKVKNVFVLSADELMDYFCACVDRAIEYHDKGYDALSDMQWKKATELREMLEDVGRIKKS